MTAGCPTSMARAISLTRNGIPRRATCVSAAAIKGYYAHLEQLGALNLYVQTQLIDFGFIAMMALMGLMFGTLVSRLGGQESWGQRLGGAAALSVMCGALCDVLENLVSFVMLADPTGFADWLALPYLTFAVAKFGLITLGLALALLSFAIGAVERGFAIYKQRQSSAASQ